MPSSDTGLRADDPFLPDEVRIYNSKSKAIFLICMLFVWLLVGVFLITHKYYIPGTILTILLSFGFFAGYKVLTDRSVHIIINVDGITTADDGFHTWDDIRDEQIVKTGEGRQTNYWLYFLYPSGKVKLDIGWFNVKHKELQQLLTDYRKIHRNNHSA